MSENDDNNERPNPTSPPNIVSKFKTYVSNVTSWFSPSRTAPSPSRGESAERSLTGDSEPALLPDYADARNICGSEILVQDSTDDEGSGTETKTAVQENTPKRPRRNLNFCYEYDPMTATTDGGPTSMTTNNDKLPPDLRVADATNNNSLQRSPIQLTTLPPELRRLSVFSSQPPVWISTPPPPLPALLATERLASSTTTRTTDSQQNTRPPPIFTSRPIPRLSRSPLPSYSRRTLIANRRSTAPQTPTRRLHSLAEDQADTNGHRNAFSQTSPKRRRSVSSSETELSIDQPRIKRTRTSSYVPPDRPSKFKNSTQSLNYMDRARLRASRYDSTSALSDSRLLHRQSLYYKGRTTYGGASAYSSGASSLDSLSKTATARASSMRIERTVIPSTPTRAVGSLGPITSQVLARLGNPNITQRTLPGISLLSQEQNSKDATRIDRLAMLRNPYARVRPLAVDAILSQSADAAYAPPLKTLAILPPAQLARMQELQRNKERMRRIAIMNMKTVPYKLPAMVNRGMTTQNIKESDTQSSQYLAAIANASDNEQPREQQQYLPKHSYKMVNKRFASNRITSSKSTQDEQQVEPLDLPNIAFPPMKSLPKFDFNVGLGSSKDTKRNNKNFNFKDPNNAFGGVASTASTRFLFYFENPVKLFGAPTERTSKTTKPSTTATTTTASKPVAAETRITVARPALRKRIKFSDTFNPKTNSWECSACMLHNDNAEVACVACQTKKPPKQPLSDIFKRKKNTWECSSCLLSNDNANAECVACQTKKPEAATSSGATKVSQSFGSYFKRKPNMWECDSCLLTNDNEKTVCVACQAKKPSAASSLETPNITQTFDNTLLTLFKRKANTWECGSCLLNNDNAKAECVACQTRKPAAAASSSEKPTEAPTSESQPLGTAFKRKENTWECSTCLLVNDSAKTMCVACQSISPIIAKCVKSATAPATRTSIFSSRFHSTTSAPVPTSAQRAQDAPPKPKPAYYYCEVCLARNAEDNETCHCCDHPRILSTASDEPTKPEINFRNVRKLAMTEISASLSSSMPLEVIFRSPTTVQKPLLYSPASTQPVADLPQPQSPIATNVPAAQPHTVNSTPCKLQLNNTDQAPLQPQPSVTNVNSSSAQSSSNTPATSTSAPKPNLGEQPIPLPLNALVSSQSATSAAEQSQTQSPLATFRFNAPISTAPSSPLVFRLPQTQPTAASNVPANDNAPPQPTMSKFAINPPPPLQSPFTFFGPPTTTENTVMPSNTSTSLSFSSSPSAKFSFSSLTTTAPPRPPPSQTQFGFSKSVFSLPQTQPQSQPPTAEMPQITTQMTGAVSAQPPPRPMFGFGGNAPAAATSAVTSAPVFGLNTQQNIGLFGNANDRPPPPTAVGSAAQQPMPAFGQGQVPVAGGFAGFGQPAPASTANITQSAVTGKPAFNFAASVGQPLRSAGSGFQFNFPSLPETNFGLNTNTQRPASAAPFQFGLTATQSMPQLQQQQQQQPAQMSPFFQQQQLQGSTSAPAMQFGAGLPNLQAQQTAPSMNFAFNPANVGGSNINIQPTAPPGTNIFAMNPTPQGGQGAQAAAQRRKMRHLVGRRQPR